MQWSVMAFSEDFSRVLDEFRQNGRDVDLKPVYQPPRPLAPPSYPPPKPEPNRLQLPPGYTTQTTPWRPEMALPSRNSRRRGKDHRFCAFCKNNNEQSYVYRSHVLKDDAGVIRCPILRVYTCPICGANGDFAHTLKYCPLRDDAVAADLRERYQQPLEQRGLRPITGRGWP